MLHNPLIFPENYRIVQNLFRIRLLEKSHISNFFTIYKDCLSKNKNHIDNRLVHPLSYERYPEKKCIFMNEFYLNLRVALKSILWSILIASPFLIIAIFCNMKMTILVPVFIIFFTTIYYISLIINTLKVKNNIFKKKADFLYDNRWDNVFLFWVIPLILSQIPLLFFTLHYFDQYFNPNRSSPIQFPFYLFSISLWPLFLLLWYIRDKNKEKEITNKEDELKKKEREIDNQSMSLQWQKQSFLLSDFHRLQEWVTNPKESVSLKVSSIYQLNRYLKMPTSHMINSSFHQSVLELFRVLLDLEASGREIEKPVREAISKSINTTDLSTDNVEILIKRSEVFEKLGMLQLALISLNRAIEIDPNNIKALNIRGITYRKLKQYDKAIVDYEKVIVLDDKFAMAYNNLGFVLSQQGKHTESIEYFEKAIQIDPQFSMALNNLGYALEFTGDLEKALKNYSEARFWDPQYWRPYLNLSRYYSKTGDFEKAVSQLVMALRYGGNQVRENIRGNSIYRPMIDRISLDEANRLELKSKTEFTD